MKTIARLSVGLALLTESFLSAQIPQRTPLPPIAGADVYCPLAGKGEMGVGWTQAVDQSNSYRCLPIFDEAFKPIGAAWVRVEKDGTIGAQLPR